MNPMSRLKSWFNISNKAYNDLWSLIPLECAGIRVLEGSPQQRKAGYSPKVCPTNKATCSCWWPGPGEYRDYLTSCNSVPQNFKTTYASSIGGEIFFFSPTMRTLTRVQYFGLCSAISTIVPPSFTMVSAVPFPEYGLAGPEVHNGTAIAQRGRERTVSTTSVETVRHRARAQSPSRFDHDEGYLIAEPYGTATAQPSGISNTSQRSRSSLSGRGPMRQLDNQRSPLLATIASGSQNQHAVPSPGELFFALFPSHPALHPCTTIPINNILSTNATATLATRPILPLSIVSASYQNEFWDSTNKSCVWLGELHIGGTGTHHLFDFKCPTPSDTKIWCHVDGFRTLSPFSAAHIGGTNRKEIKLRGAWKRGSPATDDYHYKVEFEILLPLPRVAKAGMWHCVVVVEVDVALGVGTSGEEVEGVQQFRGETTFDLSHLKWANFKHSR